MKQKDTLINKFEKAGLITVIVIWVLRVWFGPAFNYALLLTTTLLAIYYLWFGFFIFNKLRPFDLVHQHKRQSLTPFKIVTSILMGLIISYCLIAILFGFLFFPGMQTAIIFAFVVMVAFAGFIIAYQVIQKKHMAFCNRYYLRMVLFVVFLALLWIPPLEVRLGVLFRDHPDFQEAYIEYSENPECEKAKEKLRQERSRFR